MRNQEFFLDEPIPLQSDEITQPKGWKKLKAKVLGHRPKNKIRIWTSPAGQIDSCWDPASFYDGDIIPGEIILTRMLRHYLNREAAIEMIKEDAIRLRSNRPLLLRLFS